MDTDTRANRRTSRVAKRQPRRTRSAAGEESSDSAHAATGVSIGERFKNSQRPSETEAAFYFSQLAVAIGQHEIGSERLAAFAMAFDAARRDRVIHAPFCCPR